MEDNLTLSQQLGINHYPLIIFNDNNKIIYTEFSSDEYQLAIRDSDDKLIGIMFNDGFKILP